MAQILAVIIFVAMFALIASHRNTGMWSSGAGSCIWISNAQSGGNLGDTESSCDFYIKFLVSGRTGW